MATEFTVPDSVKPFCEDGSIRILSANKDCGKYSITEWNEPSLWRNAFRSLSANVTVFAEDAFGNQFCFDEKGVVSILTPDIDTLDVIAKDVDTFFASIAKNPRGTLHRNLYLMAVQRFGNIANKQHFAFMQPLVLGGDFGIDNIVILDSATNMRNIGALVQEIDYDESDMQDVDALLDRQAV